MDVSPTGDLAYCVAAGQDGLGFVPNDQRKNRKLYRIQRNGCTKIKARILRSMTLLSLD